MFIKPVGNLSFLGCKPLMQAVDTDFYTGKFVPFWNRTAEHLLPKSKKGQNSIKNYAMADKYVNNARGNMPMTKWLRLHPDFVENMRNYCIKYWDTEILGVKHGRQVNEVVNRLTGLKLVEDVV